MPLGIFRTRRELYPPKLLVRLMEWFPIVFRLAYLIRSEKISLVHTNSGGVIVGAFAARLARVPHVWHIREIISHPRVVWSLMRELIPLFSRRVICISHAVRKHLGQSRWLDDENVNVIYDGVDLHAFQPIEKDLREAHPITVGMVARVTPAKGQEDLIRAARRVVDVMPEAHFVLVGGVLPEYQSLWEHLHLLRHDLDLEANLIFAGQQPPDGIQKIVSDFDIFVLPTNDTTGIQEGLGQVILEAMALAKPVIATNVGGPPEAVLDNVTGFLVPPSNEEQMASAILRLARDQELRQRMGRAGRARAEQCFSLDQSVHAVESLYQNVLANVQAVNL